MSDPDFRKGLEAGRTCYHEMFLLPGTVPTQEEVLDMIEHCLSPRLVAEEYAALNERGYDLQPSSTWNISFLLSWLTEYAATLPQKNLPAASYTTGW
jgi:hypothetical protein